MKTISNELVIEALANKTVHLPFQDELRQELLGDMPWIDYQNGISAVGEKIFWKQRINKYESSPDKKFSIV
jgi:hypothetical protein